MYFFFTFCTLVAGMVKMRCHYDVLGIEATATDEEIRKAYRKRALAVHPGQRRSPNKTIARAHSFPLRQEPRPVRGMHG